jgi:hypothetical protein
MAAPVLPLRTLVEPPSRAAARLPGLRAPAGRCEPRQAARRGGGGRAGHGAAGAAGAAESRGAGELAAGRDLDLAGVLRGCQPLSVATCTEENQRPSCDRVERRPHPTPPLLTSPHTHPAHTHTCLCSLQVRFKLERAQEALQRQLLHAEGSVGVLQAQLADAQSGGLGRGRA